MAKKAKMIQALNDQTKPYNLQVSVGAPFQSRETNAITYNVTVTLTMMDEIKVVDGKSVQATHRVVSTSGFGASVEEAKNNALEEALQFAGVI